MKNILRILCIFLFAALLIRLIKGYPIYKISCIGGSITANGYPKILACSPFPQLFPDGVHPDSAGKKTMAFIIYEAVKKSLPNPYK